MSSSVFRCAHCGGRFVSHRSDEDAYAEMVARLPESLHVEKRDMAIICNDCYQRFERWLATKTPAQRQAMRDEYARDKGIQ